METSSIRKLKRAEKRLIELEKWKKSKNEAKELLRKMTKAPFRPVGKTVAPVKDKLLQGSMMQKSVRKSTLQTTRFSKPVQSRYSSTPLLKSNVANKPMFLPSPPPIKPFLSKKIDFENIEMIKPSSISNSRSSERMKSKVSERKSVQFKESIEKISSLSSPAMDAPIMSPKPVNEEENRITDDDIRRRSNAGRTPFSCTTSRSGSTPGRRNYPNSTLQQFTVNESNTTPVKPNEPLEPCTPKSATRRKSRSTQGKCLLKWSVSKNSIIERDPYLLRSRTPLLLNDISHNLDKTDLIDFNHSKFLTKSKKKKNMQVSFGNIVINTIVEAPQQNKSPTFDDTFCMLDKTAQQNDSLHNSVTFPTSADTQNPAKNILEYDF